MDKIDSKIHEIYEQYANSQKFNECFMYNHNDLNWLREKLDHEDYLKLEESILEYCSKNDELIFRLGFQYAWSLFHECMEEQLSAQGNSFFGNAYDKIKKGNNG